MFQSKMNGYAYLAVVELPDSTEPTALAGSVAKRHNLPGPTVARVMGQLAKAGVLQSDRGVAGGFRLARPAAKISALQVFEAINGPITNWDFLPESVPKVWRKNVTDMFDKLTDDVRKRLESTSVADLRAGKKR
jgi:Rrf2 family protein